MTGRIFKKNVSDVYFFSLAHVASANMEGAGLMTYTAASHQGAIKMFWLHFWGAVKPSIFINKQPKHIQKRFHPSANPKYLLGLTNNYLYQELNRPLCID